MGAIVRIKEVLAVDLNLWDIIVACRRDPADEGGSSARPLPEGLHGVAITNVRSDNEWRQKLRKSMLGVNVKKLGRERVQHLKQRR